jgi:branched-chain amino acid transport system permease protein
VGALVLIGLEEVLKANLDNWKLAEGLIIIAIVVALPHGVKQIWPMIFGPPQDRGRTDRGETGPTVPGATHV